MLFWTSFEFEICVKCIFTGVAFYFVHPALHYDEHRGRVNSAQLPLHSSSPQLALESECDVMWI